jgi:hypothetical protein
VSRTYRATLQVSLHEAPNPLDPIAATNWGETRASAFVPVQVEMTDQVVARDLSSTLVATRPVAAGGVWALFVDRWGPAKPVYWAALAEGMADGATYVVPAGHDRLTLGDTFAVRNIAKTVVPG